MKFIFGFITVLFVLVLVWHLLTKKYLNPYKLYVIFGPKGVGKSTLLQKLANFYIKKGYHCYCNIDDCNIKGVTQIPIEDLPALAHAGHRLLYYKDPLPAKAMEEKYKINPVKDKNGNIVDVPPFVKLDSVIFHDEINLLFDNRNFKNFRPDQQAYFRLQRHYRHIYVGFSQTFDCDKKIRDLADYIVLIKKRFRVWICSQTYYKKPVIVRPSDSNSRETATATDDFIPMGLFYNVTSKFNAWLPKWVKKHDSYK